MPAASPAWSRLLLAAADGDDRARVAEAFVDHLVQLGARVAAAWTRVEPSPWQLAHAHGGDVPDEPPIDPSWQTVTSRTARRSTTIGWTGVVLDDDVLGAIEAALHGAARRIEAQASAEVAMQAGDERLATVLDASPDAVLVVDASGTIAHANTRASDMFGYALHELVGKHIELLVPDDVRGRHASLRAGYAEAPTPRAMAAGQDLRARHREGREFPVDIALAPIQAGHQTAFAAFVRDATARHDAELQQRRLREAELARNQALELNDNVVQGLTSAVWLMEMGEVPEAVHAARDTLASARRMMRDLMDDNRSAVAPGGLQRSQPVPSSGFRPHTGAGTTTITKPLRLLVADDSEDIRLLLDVRLRSVPDIELVAMAADGIEAVAAADEHRPDVVLMDLSMPQLDGLEATALIRQRHPNIRVVVLTGHPRTTVQDQAAAAGAHAVIEKGGAFDELLHLVRSAE